jgi:hypothetical protein
LQPCCDGKDCRPRCRCQAAEWEYAVLEERHVTIYHIDAVYQRRVIDQYICLTCGFVLPFDGRSYGVVMLDRAVGFTIAFMHYATTAMCLGKGTSVSTLTDLHNTTARPLPDGACMTAWRCAVMARTTSPFHHAH